METGDQLLGRMVTINGVRVKIVGVWAIEANDVAPAAVLLLIVTATGQLGLHSAFDPALRLIDPMEKPSA